MQAGDLSERVAFDAPHNEEDGYGGHERGWRERSQRRAHFRWLRGGETVQAARLSGRQPVVATVRADPDTREIATGWRMRDLRTEEINERGDVTRGAYNVRAVVETPDRMWIEITAESGVAT